MNKHLQKMMYFSLQDVLSEQIHLLNSMDSSTQQNSRESLLRQKKQLLIRLQAE